ncbi:MAG: phosphate--AMP phosphotransferase [Lachnospiraceae bacterium]|nr:phosphate--AMP phosphotransferase [Oscillospiraceae bacterium]MDY5647440.1 phosphate--AMP phosphotransferase [Lachnospiraceae bacterium]
MLEKLDLNKKLDKAVYKEKKEALGIRLARLQRECREAGIPVIIVFEGFGAAGKGTQINELISNLDPRGFQVYAINGESEEEKLRPFLWRFWTKTPQKGRIAIFDRSWYRKVLVDRFDGVTTKEQLGYAYDEINSFEKQLTDDGTVVLKLFLAITKAEQKKRFKKLLANEETAWRVTKQDLKRNKEYDRFLLMNEEMLEKTDTEYAPWTIVEANDKKYATVKILTAAADKLEEALRRKKEKSVQKPSPMEPDPQRELSSKLASADLSLTMDRETYKKRLKELQDKLMILHSELYRTRIPVILAFEGWDAAGKGGAIKRLTGALDPRGYEVHPTASPNDIEKAHHYLWRFWRDIPKGGHIAIFDRTWYGRVMVERIEGFCTEQEWKRAYKEINDMEATLANYGAIVLKFWLHIDKDEQERRFNDRMQDPEKRWKITDEDWRNRAKWDAYEQAVDDMLIKTSTTYAPWIIVEANSKYYARIKVLESVVQALEERMHR